MKLYYFGPDSYSEEFSVMAESNEAAIEYIRKYCKEKDEEINLMKMRNEDAGDILEHYYSKSFEENLKNGTYYEFGVGEVLETEIS